MEPQQDNSAGLSETKDHLALLRCVTPLSRYFAMALFIVLPFLGGYVGYSYAPESVVEVEKVVVKNLTPVTEVETSENEGELSYVLTSEDSTFPTADIFVVRSTAKVLIDDSVGCDRGQFVDTQELANSLVSTMVNIRLVDSLNCYFGGYGESYAVMSGTKNGGDVYEFLVYKKTLDEVIGHSPWQLFSN